MGRHRADLAVIERQARLRRERMERARAEDQALDERLAETVALGEARGEAFAGSPGGSGQPRKPMRRMTGLEWLKSRGRITDDQLAAGLRYGACYRGAAGETRLRSQLNREPGGGAWPLTAVLAGAEARASAARKLAMHRERLFNQDGMVRACDLICGEERTPREATSNGRTAEGIEAVLRVALDLLAR